MVLIDKAEFCAVAGDILPELEAALGAVIGLIGEADGYPSVDDPELRAALDRLLASVDALQESPLAPWVVAEVKQQVIRSSRTLVWHIERDYALGIDFQLALLPGALNDLRTACQGE